MVKIKGWSKMNNPEFRNSLIVFLDTSGNEDLLEKYDLQNERQLELAFVVTRDFISYKIGSSIYDLREKDLLKIASDNQYKLLKFPKSINFKDVLILGKNIADNDIRFIPMDEGFLIDSSENDILEFSIDGLDLRCEDI